MKTLRLLPSVLWLSAFCILHSTFFISRASAQLSTGTYYYDTEASTPDNQVFISTNGIQYHVDSGGLATETGTVAFPVTTPYILTVNTSGTHLQFDNAHQHLYTLATGTDGSPLVTYAARSGTWTARDTTLHLATGTDSVIRLTGATGAQTHPATFIGENLTINATGANTGAITMGDGNNTLILVDSAINSTTTRNNNSQAILLDDTLGLGGNHFTGTNLTITNASGRVFAFARGDNTITLHNSTIVNNGTGAAFGWNATSSSYSRVFTKASTVTLHDTTVITTANYSPVFQAVGEWAAAFITGGTLITEGANSPVLRLVGQNDQIDNTTFDGIIKNSILESRQSSVIDINIDAASTSYGTEQIGGGAANLTTTVGESYDILIQSSTLTGATAALRIAVAGRNAFPRGPYSNITDVLVLDSRFSGGIEMVAGGGTNETSGAYLTFTAYDSELIGGLTITGTEAARLSHQATFHVYNSTWTGDITLTNRGNLVLHFTDTLIEGALTLSGSTDVDLRLKNSPITGPIAATDTALLTGYATGSGTVGPITAAGRATIDLDLDHMPAGPITATDAATLTLRVGNPLLAIHATLPGGIHLSGSATLDLTLRDATRFTGDITINDRATLALATTTSSPLAIDGNIALAGIWRIPAKTTLTGALALTGTLGTIAIENARPGSLVLSNGLTGAGRLDILSIAPDSLKHPEIHVIQDQTSSFAPGTLILARPADYGLASYTLENRPDGVWLIGGLSSAGAAIVNTQAMIVEDWFASLAPINHRHNQFRHTPAGASTADRASGKNGSLWLQARSDNARIDRPGAPLDFTARTLGLTAGADTRWDFDTATLSIGIFADTARTIRDFIDHASGRTTGAGAGLHAHYHHTSGLYLSAIARFDVCENTLDTNKHTNALTASYHTQSGGLALEAGWRFDLGKGWWLEPAAQFAHANLPGLAYTTQSNRPVNRIDITISDARATQLQGRLAFGKQLHKHWHLRGHLAHATIDSTGGAITVPGLDNTALLLAGTRTEASLGIARHIGRTGRLTLDAAHTAASDYTRPLTLSLGWSMNW